MPAAVGRRCSEARQATGRPSLVFNFLATTSYRRRLRRVTDFPRNDA